MGLKLIYRVVETSSPGSVSRGKEEGKRGSRKVQGTLDRDDQQQGNDTIQHSQVYKCSVHLHWVCDESWCAWCTSANGLAPASSHQLPFTVTSFLDISLCSPKQLMLAFPEVGVLLMYTRVG